MTETYKITVEIPKEEHKYLKMLCKKLDTDIKDFIVKTIIKQIEEIEDESMYEKANKIMQDIRSGKANTFPFKEIKQQLI